MEALQIHPAIQVPMPAGVSEHEIVAHAQQGAAWAFDALYAAHHQAVFLHCRKRRLAVEEAEDVTQEVFLKVYRNLKDYSHEFRFSTWLYRVTENAVVDQIRRRQRQQARFLPMLTDEDGQEVDVPDLRSNSLSELELSELQRHLAGALAELSPVLRACFELKEQEHLSYEQIADRMQCTVGTVKSRLHRARKELMKRLQAWV